MLAPITYLHMGCEITDCQKVSETPLHLKKFTYIPFVLVRIFSYAK